MKIEANPITLPSQSLHKTNHLHYRFPKGLGGPYPFCPSPAGKQDDPVDFGLTLEKGFCWLFRNPGDGGVGEAFL
jgi:hypothetical protein